MLSLGTELKAFKAESQFAEKESGWVPDWLPASYKNYFSLNCFHLIIAI